MSTEQPGPRWAVESSEALPLRHAICLTCGWSTEPWTGTRLQAVEHLEATGHLVDWHLGTQETLRPGGPVPQEPPAPTDPWEEAPRPTDQGSLAEFLTSSWPQKSFQEGVDALASVAWTSDPGLLARADQAAAYVRRQAQARAVRVGDRWISRRNWIKLASLAYVSAFALAAGVAILLGHLLALGSYPTAGP